MLISQDSSYIKSKQTLPPIKLTTNSSMIMLKKNWKFVGPSSPLLKQESNNSVLKCRRRNVVLNLKRSLKNPHSYISNESSLEVDFERLQDRYKKLTLKLKQEEEY